MKMKLAIIGLLLFSLSAEATTKDDGETRTAKFNFDVSPQDVINIQSKYTDLTVESWDKKEVEVEATIRFDGKMTDKMQKFLDSFEEEVGNGITQSPSELLIKTNLDEPNKFQLGTKHVGLIIISFDEDELKLEYTVRIPSTNTLFVKNSYRDVYLKGEFEEVEIDQYSGELEADVIEDLTLKLKYGSASFEEVSVVDMDLYEQEITAGTIGELKIETKYSDIKIDNLNTAEMDSYETDFEIERAGSIKGTFKYGKMEIKDQLESGRITTYEFDIEANSIDELIFENSKYGKLECKKINRLDLAQSYEDEFDLEYLGKVVSNQTKYGDYKIGRLGQSLELSGYEDEISILELEPSASRIEIKGKYVETTLDLDNRPYQLIANTKYGDINVDKESDDIKKYIKDGDQLEIEASSGDGKGQQIMINIQGYEMDLDLDQ